MPYDGIQYVKDANGDVVPYVPPPPRRFTERDRERANKNRDRRHTRVWYNKTLEAFIEGRFRCAGTKARKTEGKENASPETMNAGEQLACLGSIGAFMVTKTGLENP